MRLGEDSQRKFDQCGLCLQRLTDPIGTPSGYLFCRGCLLENLLAQKDALAEQKQRYDAEQATLRREAELKAQKLRIAQISQFEKDERSVGGLGSFSSAVGAGLTPEAALMAQRSMKVDPRNKQEKQAEVGQTAFWAPAVTPVAKEGSVPKPDALPRDPASGAFLRSKDLLSVKLHRLTVEDGDDDGAGPGAGQSYELVGDGSGAIDDNGAAATAAGAASSSAASSSSSVAYGGVVGLNGVASKPRGGSSSEARFGCPACLKGILYQRTFLMKPCGHVLCDKCVVQFVAPAKACFVCNAAITAKQDLVALQVGGSSFSSHAGTQAEAKKYTYGGIS